MRALAYIFERDIEAWSRERGTRATDAGRIRREVCYKRLDEMNADMERAQDEVNARLQERPRTYAVIGWPSGNSYKYEYSAHGIDREERESYVPSRFLLDEHGEELVRIAAAARRCEWGMAARLALAEEARSLLHPASVPALGANDLVRPASHRQTEPLHLLRPGTRR